MSRRAIILVATMAAALVAASGVAWAATIQCPGGFCQGTAKSDVIRGTDAFDRIIAWGGNDTVSGFGTGDEIYGVFGNDKLSGGPGGDYLDGGPGNDKLSGDVGNDIIDAIEPEGTTGIDRVSGGEGDYNTVRANDGQVDHIRCGGVTDTVVFDEGLDRVSPDCEVLIPVGSSAS